MRAIVNIDHVPLSSKMAVTFVDGRPASGDPVMAHKYVVDAEDAEYRLLAQAIDRFVAVQEALRAIGDVTGVTEA